MKMKHSQKVLPGLVTGCNISIYMSHGGWPCGSQIKSPLLFGFWAVLRRPFGNISPVLSGAGSCLPACVLTETPAARALPCDYAAGGAGGDAWRAGFAPANRIISLFVLKMGRGSEAAGNRGVMDGWAAAG